MLGAYVKAGYPAIVLITPEEGRALKECQEVAAKNKMNFETWSCTRDGKNGAMVNPITPLEEGIKTGNTLYCVLDFHPFLKTANVWRKAKDVFKIAKVKGVTFVFISAKFDVPMELEREIVTISLPLPTRTELRTLLERMSNEHQTPLPENPTFVVEAALGLTWNEAENVFATSIASYGRFDTKLISKLKGQIICNNGLLEYWDSEESLETVGGLKTFTSWAVKRLSAYSEAAREYGLPYPRGVLLIGIPGCGKSLTAKALANIWQKPLLRLDVGKLFGSFVGETEANTRKVIEIAEAMSPAILWIDEVEKGFSGVQSSARTDSGTTSRMFATFLTWLQEKKAPVFVIATANDISLLPPEFLRKGRFDEVFFVDLPDEKERKDIFQIQLRKHKRNPSNFDVEGLAAVTEHYTGAEIEETVITALFSAWNDGKREVTTEDIYNALSSISPMATGIMKDRIDGIRAWSEETKVRKANGIKPPEEVQNTGRIIRQGQ